MNFREAHSTWRSQSDRWKIGICQCKEAFGICSCPAAAAILPLPSPSLDQLIVALYYDCNNLLKYDTGFEILELKLIENISNLNSF